MDIGSWCEPGLGMIWIILLACLVFVAAALIIAIAVRFLRAERADGSASSQVASARQQFDARYAAGAIGREAYLKQRNALKRKG
jgi:uncharacterized membrane protein